MYSTTTLLHLKNVALKLLIMNQQHETYIYDYVLKKITLPELLNKISITSNNLNLYIENLLLGSISEKDADAIENAILLAIKTDTTINQVLLGCLFSFPWHNQHEEIIDFIDPTNVNNLPVFLQAINSKLEYLDPLDQETLQIKALYAIDKNSFSHKVELLKGIANLLNGRVRLAAETIINKHS